MIALITAGAHDFGDYALALLSLAGLSAERVALDALDDAALPDRIVLAGDLPLRESEIAALRAKVEAGARIVWIDPHPLAADALGLGATYRATVDGRFRLGDGPWLQCHAALRHRVVPDIAEVLATTEAGDPAIVRLRRGEGEVIATLFDLPRAVALIRQGDPRRRGLHGNRVAPGWRAADLFAGFLNLDCADIPQADVLCAALRDWLITPLTHDAGLPYLWPFPDGAPSVLLLSSDDDWSTEAQFAALDACVRKHNASISYYLVPETIITPEWKTAREALGDTFSLHPVHHEPLARTWDDTVHRHRAAFVQRFGSEPGISVRNHVIPWIGYVEGARRNAATGFLWDTNFFTCPPETRHYMCGAGLPAPFVDETGEVLPVWQQPCHFSDETTLAAGGFEFSLKLDEDEAAAQIAALLAANAASSTSLLCINTHPVSFATYSGGMWDRVLTEATRLGIPCLALETFAEFWERRAAARIEPDGGGGWRLIAPRGDAGLTVVGP